jgi:hypothetical protein
MHQYFQFKIENVSRHLVWAFLHAHPFYNSEQVSQRYVKVSQKNLYIPDGLTEENKAIYLQTCENLFANYLNLSEKLRPATEKHFHDIFKKSDRNEKKHKSTSKLPDISCTTRNLHRYEKMWRFRHARNLVRKYNTPQHGWLGVQIHICAMRRIHICAVHIFLNWHAYMRECFDMRNSLIELHVYMYRRSLTCKDMYIHTCTYINKDVSLICTIRERKKLCLITIHIKLNTCMSFIHTVRT